MQCEQLTSTDGQEVRQTPTELPRRNFVPPVDIVELPEELLLTAEVPGTLGEQIDVRFEDGELRIDAPVAPRTAGKNFLLEEYAVGSYVRSFRLGQSIDGTRISAEYVDGVLTLHLPKVEAAKPRRIAVRTN
ncbi:MAG: Hsp20/alpha crystallin family protein [Planctomycetales bacterium]|nr:Hsp20/alpha crystallin family protein [Planctomycetales bacterium]